nr:MAG TPA: hypothetical protein [Caudoviricetes sp.]
MNVILSIFSFANLKYSSISSIVTSLPLNSSD